MKLSSFYSIYYKHRVDKAKFILKSINENRPIIVIQRNINDISSSRYKLLAKSIDAITTIELTNKPA